MSSTEKISIRSRVLAARNAVPADQASLAAQTAAQGGVALVARLAAELNRTLATLTVSAFWPMRSELDTRPLLDQLHRLGCQLALPVVLGPNLPLEFRRYRPGDILITAAFGQAEPTANAPVIEPDVLFVPLAAVAMQGYRIGYGGGFYDRSLAALRARKPVVAIGFAFDLQRVDTVPIEPHDEPLDWLVTPALTLNFRNAACD